MDARRGPFLSQVEHSPSIFLAALGVSVSGLEISGFKKQAKAGTLQSHGAKPNRLTPLSVAKKNHDLSRSQCWDSRNQLEGPKVQNVDKDQRGRVFL